MGSAYVVCVLDCIQKKVKMQIINIYGDFKLDGFLFPFFAKCRPILSKFWEMLEVNNY